MLKDSGMIHRGRGLVDLIAGKTPTFVDWTTDPTDAANITDGDISTSCTTAEKIAGAGYQYAYMDWDLGGLYDVLCGAVVAVGVTAGTGKCRLFLWDGANWIEAASTSSENALSRISPSFSGRASKVRLGFYCNIAATITPNIRELHAWRL